MKTNFLHFITAATGSFKGFVAGFRLRLKQITILTWCVIAIAFLSGCITGPMRQGIGSYIPNLLRKPYPSCESTIGQYMNAFRAKGQKIWSGSSGEHYQSRHIVPPAKDYLEPKQFVLLSKMPDLRVNLPETYIPFVKGECDSDEFTIYYFIYVKVIPELEARVL